jgi:hypothetical protein
MEPVTAAIENNKYRETETLRVTETRKQIEVFISGL